MKNNKENRKAIFQSKVILYVLVGVVLVAIVGGIIVAKNLNSKLGKNEEQVQEEQDRLQVEDIEDENSSENGVFFDEGNSDKQPDASDGNTESSNNGKGTENSGNDTEGKKDNGNNNDVEDNIGKHGITEDKDSYGNFF